RKGARWRLVGNAVSVQVARWVGDRLVANPSKCAHPEQPLGQRESWPKAAWGSKGRSFRVALSLWPIREPYQHLEDFLSHRSTPLSVRATAGFLARTQVSSLRFPSGFLREVRMHASRMRRELSSA